MPKSQFKTSYSWHELQPIHPLCYTVFAAQAIGATLSVVLNGSGDRYYALWFGGAAATLPGFLCGLLVQARMRRRSIAANRQKIILLGVIATFFLIEALTK